MEMFTGILGQFTAELAEVASQSIKVAPQYGDLAAVVMTVRRLRFRGKLVLASNAVTP